jgi:hypothetical protein
MSAVCLLRRLTLQLAPTTESGGDWPHKHTALLGLERPDDACCRGSEGGERGSGGAGDCVATLGFCYRPRNERLEDLRVQVRQALEVQTGLAHLVSSQFGQK